MGTNTHTFFSGAYIEMKSVFVEKKEFGGQIYGKYTKYKK